MGLSPNIAQGEAVTEEKNPIGESHSASTDDQPNDEAAIAKDDSEAKAPAEQATSLKDYFVCLQHQNGALAASVICY